MDQQPAGVPGEPSPMKNFVGGGGCGCGCLGALVVLVGSILLVGIPLEFYEGETTGIVVAGGASAATGVLIGIIGVVMWAGSLFMD